MESVVDAVEGLREACLTDLKKQSFQELEVKRREQLSYDLLRLPRTSPLTIPVTSQQRTGEKWEAGTILRVRFLGGSEEEQRAVKEFPGEWSKNANVGFRFDLAEEETAEIRIAFDADEGNWSVVGKDALRVPNDMATMNLMLGRSVGNNARGLILHQFGHVLGLRHEHDPPPAGIRWKKEIVWNALSGVQKDAIDEYFFQKLDECSIQYSNFEKTSIMRCPIPYKWLKNHKDALATTWIQELCDQDKLFIGYEYPGATALFKTEEILSLNCEVKYGGGAEYNSYYKHSWRLIYSGSSFVEVTFNHLPGALEKGRYKKIFLNLVHLTSYTQAISHSPVDFLINGAPPKGANYSPPSNNYYEDKIDITRQVVNGKNTITLRLQKDAATHYWIQSLKVVYT